MGRIYSVGDPVILAHRGGANEFPENTPEAFAATASRGFIYLETDARVTADGVAVLSHDPTLERTTTARGLVSSYTWRELSRVKTTDGKAAIMRVDEALTSFPDLIFNIDAKHDAVVEPLAEAIVRAGATERVCVASFSESRLRALRKLLPTISSSLGVSAVARIVVAARILRKSSRRHSFDFMKKKAIKSLRSKLPLAEVAQVPVRTKGVSVLTQDFIEVAHSLGIAVHAWTINDVDEAERLLAMGVDGIVTDIPQYMRNTLGERGILM